MPRVRVRAGDLGLGSGWGRVRFKVVNFPGRSVNHSHDKYVNTICVYVFVADNLVRTLLLTWRFESFAGINTNSRKKKTNPINIIVHPIPSITIL